MSISIGLTPQVANAKSTNSYQAHVAEELNNGTIGTTDPEAKIIKASKIEHMPTSKVRKVLGKYGHLRVVGHITPGVKRRLQRKFKKANKAGMHTTIGQMKLSGYGLNRKKGAHAGMSYGHLVRNLSSRKLGHSHKKADMHALNKFLKARNLTGRQYTKLYREMHKNKRGASKKGLHRIAMFYDSVIRMQVRHYMYKAINSARSSHGVQRNKKAKNLQKIAGLRAKQAARAYETQPTKAAAEQKSGNDKYSDGWIHGMMHHDTTEDDAKKLHVSMYTKDVKRKGRHVMYTWGENAGSIVIGRRVGNSSNYRSDQHVACVLTPRQIAYNEISSMMNYDRASHNGHRKNILGKIYHYMGVGVYFTVTGHGKGRTIHGAITQEFE